MLWRRGDVMEKKGMLRRREDVMEKIDYRSDM